MNRKLTKQQLALILEKFKNDRDVLRTTLRGIFSNPENILLFAWYVFPHHVKLQSPAFHDEILQLINSDTNVGIAAPRGHAKSTIVDLVYLSWLILNERKHYIILVSDTYSQSVGFVGTLRDELDNNETVLWLYGNIRGEKWQEDKFETNRGVMVQARAYGMKIRGLKYRQYRPELLLFDDLENDESVKSNDQREKLKKWFTLAALPAMAKNGRAVVIGTILHGDSLLMNIISQNGEFAGWKTKLYKALNYDANGENPTALWPDMYSVKELTAMRSDPNDPNYKGSFVFAQEYQNEPIDEMDAIILRKWIDIIDMPQQKTILKRGFTGDPAISKTDTADFFAKARGFTYYEVEPITNIKELHLIITQLGNDKFSFQEGIDDIVSWFNQEQTDIVGLELVAFQQAYAASLPIPVTSLVPDKDKRRRTLAISRFFEGNRIHFLKGITNLDLAIDQLVHFPSVKHDDMVDAITYLIDMLMFNTSLPVRDEKEKELSAQVNMTRGLRSRSF